VKRGFSVVEVLITVVVVSLAVLPILTTFVSGAREAAFDEYFVAAQTVGMTLVERTIDQLNENGFSPTDQTHPAKSQGGYSLEDFDYRIRAVPQDADAWLWLVKVTVSWHLPTDPKGAVHTFTIDRLVSRPDASFTGRYPFRRAVDPNP